MKAYKFVNNRKIIITAADGNRQSVSHASFIAQTQMRLGVDGKE
jgi:hypothetical protein